jgi:hypothetical protein
MIPSLKLKEKYFLWILIVDTVDFLCNIWLFILFKILIQIFKIICYISNFFSNKTNHNKIYEFSKNILNKTNDQTLWKKSMTSTIKIRIEYINPIVPAETPYSIFELWMCRCYKNTLKPACQFRTLDGKVSCAFSTFVLPCFLIIWIIDFRSNDRMTHKVEGVKYKMNLTWGCKNKMNLKSMVQILRKYESTNMMRAQDTFSL